MLSPWAKKELSKIKSGWLPPLLFAMAVAVASAIVYLQHLQEYTWMFIVLGLTVVIFAVWFWCALTLNDNFGESKLGWIEDPQHGAVDTKPMRRQFMQLLAPIFLAYFTLRDKRHPKRPPTPTSGPN